MITCHPKKIPKFLLKGGVVQFCRRISKKLVKPTFVQITLSLLFWNLALWLSVIREIQNLTDIEKKNKVLCFSQNHMGKQNTKKKVLQLWKHVKKREIKNKFKWYVNNIYSFVGGVTFFSSYDFSHWFRTLIKMSVSFWNLALWLSLIRAIQNLTDIE